ncbi:MAG: SemiSWEET transporter [Nitrospinae bacterium]|nr:SemiSWEET transporter [Nitrospinota bacterium]
MSITDLLGFIAGTLTTVAFVPQVLKTWRSGTADDISGPWIATFIIGVALWLCYGVALGSLPIIIFNAVTLVLLLPILIVKIKCVQRAK